MCSPFSRHPYSPRGWRERILRWPHSVEPGLISQMAWLEEHPALGNDLARAWLSALAAVCSCPGMMLLTVGESLRAAECLVRIGVTLSCSSVARAHEMGAPPTHEAWFFSGKGESHDDARVADGSGSGGACTFVG